MSDEIECAAAFRRYCSEELVDPRLEQVLEEAFVNGWIAHSVLKGEPPARTVALKRSVRGQLAHGWIV